MQVGLRSLCQVAHPIPVVQVKALGLLTHLSHGKSGVIQDSSSILESFAKPHRQVVQLKCCRSLSWKNPVRDPDSMMCSCVTVAVTPPSN